MKKLLPIVLVSMLIALAVFGAGCTSSNNTASGAKLQLAGSTSVQPHAELLAKAFQANNSGVQVFVQGGGSSAGVTAVGTGTADIGMSSANLSASQKSQYPNLKAVPIAVDGIAIIVNPANPITQLSLQQISDIYSGKYQNWSELGGEDRPIVRVSRETNSGTHVYFLEQVLRLGEKDNKTMFSPDTLLLPSSQGITSEVRDNPNAIGYDGLGYVTPDVKVIAVASEDQGAYILPSAESVNQGTYPVARDLYIYSAGQPSADIQEYLDWIVSAEGQAIVTDNGFVPIANE